MDQADTMRLCQGAAHLAQDVNHTPFGLRAETTDEPVEIDAAEILHRVIKQTFWGSPVIIDRDSVWMRELAGHLHFMLKARGG